jgi:hypothetical protein
MCEHVIGAGGGVYEYEGAGGAACGGGP